MGKDWDKAVPSVEIWKESLRVLKPGAFAFVMCIPRQDCLARMITNLQDGGFDTNFTSIYWTYASGFPKSYNIAKGVEGKLKLGTANWSEWDKLDGEKGIYNLGYHKSQLEQGYRKKDYYGRTRTVKVNLTTQTAKSLCGSYAGFQPKPAVEIIIVAMKPLSEKTYVDQALKNKKGIVWFDDCRIPYQNDNDKESARFGTQTDIRGNAYNKNRPSDGHILDKNVLSSSKGRFPANLLVSDDILNDGKIRKNTYVLPEYQQNRTKTGFIDLGHGGLQGYNDSGSFSRYFDIDKWFNERFKKLPKEVQKTFPFLIVPKPSVSEKNRGLEQFKEKNTKFFKTKGGTGEPSSLSNTYVDGKPRPPTKMKNTHPTVKSILLMSYLITLGSREKDIVLDIFAGTGTTCIASKMLSRKYIGIEISPEYVEIAKARLKSIVTLNDWI